jgi:hypothetical protein
MTCINEDGVWDVAEAVALKLPASISLWCHEGQQIILSNEQ